MRIGLTYDLRNDYLKAGYTEEETAEFDRADTIDALEKTIRSLGHETDRIGHAKSLVSRLAAGDRWDLVFNIAEGLRGLAREAQVPALLDLYEIPYTFSDPLTLALTLDKGMTKRVLRAEGLPTPDFREVFLLEEVDRVDLPFPLFAKPLAEGTGKGIDAGSVIRNRAELRRTVQRLLDRFLPPVLVETYLPGREFTVGIVGTGSDAEALGTLEVKLLESAEPGVYSYVNKERCEELVEYRLVRAGEDPEVALAEEYALAAWRVLRGRDGGRIDLRSDEQGRPQLMELNPLAGIHPEHSDLPILCTKLGIPYRTLIGRILDSAFVRLRADTPAGRS